MDYFRLHWLPEIGIRQPQAKRMKYMDVVANAIMLQNVVDLTEVLNNMAEEGLTLTPELVGGLSPYMREHILRFGQWMLNMDGKSKY